MSEVKQHSDLVPLAHAHSYLGLNKDDFWRAIDIAGVSEVIVPPLHPYYTRPDLERVRLAAMDLKPKTRRYVYVVRIGTRGHFKFGIANDPQRRLIALQTACPYQLQLAHQEPGDFGLEQRLHTALADYRTHGEWFSPHKVVTRFVRVAQRRGLREALAQLIPLENSRENRAI